MHSQNGWEGWRVQHISASLAGYLPGPALQIAHGANQAQAYLPPAAQGSYWRKWKCSPCTPALTIHTCINQHPWAAFTPCPWLQHFTAPQSSSYWPIVISTYPRVARTATGHWLSHWCPPWTTVRQHETPTQSFFTGSAASRIFFSTRLHLFFRVSNTQTKAQTPRGASTAINGTMSPTEI